MILLMIKLWLEASIKCMNFLIKASIFTIILLFNFYIFCIDIIINLFKPQKYI